MQNTPSVFAVPRPSPSFPSLAVRSPASVASNRLASFPSLVVRLLQATGSCKGLGKKLIARGVSAYQSSKQVYCNLSFSSVEFYKSTALLYGR